MTSSLKALSTFLIAQYLCQQIVVYYFAFLFLDVMACGTELTRRHGWRWKTYHDAAQQTCRPEHGQRPDSRQTQTADEDSTSELLPLSSDIDTVRDPEAFSLLDQSKKPFFEQSLAEPSPEFETFNTPIDCDPNSATCFTCTGFVKSLCIRWRERCPLSKLNPDTRPWIFIMSRRGIRPLTRRRWRERALKHH